MEAKRPEISGTSHRTGQCVCVFSNNMFCLLLNYKIINSQEVQENKNQIIQYSLCSNSHC